MSTQTKHTPGPWLYRKAFFGGSGKYTPAIFHGDTSSVMCFLNLSGAYGGYEGIDRADSDARLIAAAPDLLAALRMASVLLWKNSKALRHPNPQDIDEAFEAMRAAIAKATGQS